MKQTIKIFILAILLFCVLPIVIVEFIGGRLTILIWGLSLLLVLYPIFFAKPTGCEYEVILIHEKLGY